MRHCHKLVFVVVLGITTSCFPVRGGERTQPEFRVAISVSPFAELLLQNGVTFTDGSVTATDTRSLQQLFVKHGSNEVFARIATSQHYRRGFGDHSMDRGLERARMAKALNLPFNPELGLFGIYGDIRCQPAPDFSDYPEIKVPGTWASLTLEQMSAVLHAYGAVAARQILSTGVKVRIWDLGNEVEIGTAGVAVQPMPGGCNDTEGGPGWYKAPDKIDPEIGKMSALQLLQMPEDRRIAWLQQHLWPYEGKLLSAVAEGVRSVDPHAHFSTHVSGVTAVLPHQAVEFYSAMKRAGFTVDEMGVSFYPTSSANPPDRLQAFKETAAAMQRTLNRPVFVAELGYPAARMESGFIWNDALSGYPLTARGQADFIRDLAEWGSRTGILSGIRPWAPDIPGTPWGPMSLFDRRGKAANARPALDSIYKGIQSAGSPPAERRNWFPIQTCRDVSLPRLRAGLSSLLAGPT